jgi:hypothetical protein
MAQLSPGRRLQSPNQEMGPTLAVGRAPIEVVTVNPGRGRSLAWGYLPDRGAAELVRADDDSAKL